MFVLGKFAEAFRRWCEKFALKDMRLLAMATAMLRFLSSHGKSSQMTCVVPKMSIEQIVGEQVNGYRAPDFSIVRHTLWALEVLAEAGFQYDSSIFPVYRTRYGIPDWPLAPVQVCLPGQKILQSFPSQRFHA